MSINTIQISKKAVGILFAKSLVEARPEKKATDQKIKNKLKSLGGNKKKILFLITDSQSKFLPDPQMDLLSNLLTACKLNMEDIALVNYGDRSFNYHQILEHFHPKKILMFGIDPSALELPFTIPHFQIQSFQDQLYVSAPPFNHFLDNKDLKKELWKCLQKLFLNQ